MPWLMVLAFRVCLHATCAGKESSAAIQPVFISVDPERDSVSQVRTYIKESHPRLIGLTGSAEQVSPLRAWTRPSSRRVSTQQTRQPGCLLQVKAAAKAYRVYYTKSSEEEDYLVDHSIIMYLINPDGEFVTFYGKNFDAPMLAQSLQGHLASWAQRNSSQQQQAST